MERSKEIRQSGIILLKMPSEKSYWKNSLKGTVGRDLKRVKNRLKQFVLITCKTASLYFLI
jgi:hypothetical protein